MAFEMYGMLAGNVSALTGEYVKPAYGGEKEAFLRKVVTPIYNTIAKVVCSQLIQLPQLTFMLLSSSVLPVLNFIFSLQHFRKLKGARERKEIILSGETMMILMNTSGINFFSWFICSLSRYYIVKLQVC